MNRPTLLTLTGMAIVMLAAMTGALSQDDLIKGDYRKIAACVFKQLDPMSPGNFRLTSLPDEIMITFETSGGGMTFRAMKATFAPAGVNRTSIEVEGQPPGYYPSKVRPLANECSQR